MALNYDYVGLCRAVRRKAFQTRIKAEPWVFTHFLVMDSIASQAQANLSTHSEPMMARVIPKVHLKFLP